MILLFCQVLASAIRLFASQVNTNFSNQSISFDVIFLDPPYKEKALENILNKIIRDKILKDNGIIIIHRHKKETDKFPKNFQLIDEKKYGISKIIFGSYS